MSSGTPDGGMVAPCLPSTSCYATTPPSYANSRHCAHPHSPIRSTPTAATSTRPAPDNMAWCMASCRSVSIQSMLDLNKWAEEGHVPKPSAGDGIAVATEGRHQENEQSDRPKEAAESYEKSTARGESRTVRRTGTLFELERSRRACLGPVPELRRELLDGGGDLLDGSRLTAQ